MANEPGELNPAYKKHQNQVKKISDVYDGIDEAKKYLQQYNQEDTKDYGDRKDIATLDNFVFRAVDDIKNIIFRKPLDLTSITNATLKEHMKRINFTDNINEFAKNVLVNRIKDGYTFILVDTPAYDTEKIKTQADITAAGIRPYFVNILRKDVLNWKKNETGEYTQIVIQEGYTTEGEYGSGIGTQIKVWNSDGTVEIWRDGAQYGETTQTALRRIPIVKVGNDDIPPLYDLTKINITHMNRDSELSNYTRVGGAPFLAVFGKMDDGKAPNTLGINKGLNFKDKQECDVKWVEMAGTNYEMIKSRILYHEDQMNRISVSFTTETENKTATQVNKESMTGESKATHYASELEDGINNAITMMNLFSSEAKIAEDNKVGVNKDFDSSILTPEMVTSYRTDYLAGLISYEMLVDYLIAGEYFKEMTKEEIATEKARLMDNPTGGDDL